MVARVFMVIALIFGGGGSPSPFPEFVVEIAAIGALVLFYLLPPLDRSMKNRPDWLVFVGAVILVAIPIVQLIPLPPAVWHLLPGRDLEVASLSLIDQQDSWRAMSLSPYTTFASLLSLIPPLAMLAMTRYLPLAARSELIRIVVYVAIAAAVLGVVQLIGDSHRWLRFYEHTHLGFATGFDANRNADADLLLAGLIGICAILAHQRRRELPRTAQLVTLALIVFLILSLFATGSRTGTALLLIAMLGGVSILWSTSKDLIRRRLAPVIGVVALIGAGSAILLSHNARLQKTIERFSADSDARTSEIWPDTIYAIKQHFPIGSGMGTFTPIFKTGERLEVVNPSVPNRAHNDYMEFTLEAGALAVGALLFALIAVYWRGANIVIRAKSPRHRDQAIFALGMLTIFWLHSLVDYPMREMALATVAALAVGLLSFHPARERAGQGNGTGSKAVTELVSET